MEKGDVERSIKLLEGLEELGDIKELMDIVMGNGNEKWDRAKIAG